MEMQMQMQSIKEALRYLMGFAGPSGFGSSSTADQVTDDHDQDSSHPIFPPNLTAIITGATSGIGAETARVLAKRGLRLIIPARDVKRAAEVRERIRRESPTAEIVVMEMDLSSIASIRRFCVRFLALRLPLNILINNAGKFCRKLQFTEDKYEMTFATNYLDPIFTVLARISSPSNVGLNEPAFCHVAEDQIGPNHVRNGGRSGWAESCSKWREVRIGQLTIDARGRYIYTLK